MKKITIKYGKFEGNQDILPHIAFKFFGENCRYENIGIARDKLNHLFPHYHFVFEEK